MTHYARGAGTTTFTLPERSDEPLNIMARNACVLARDGTHWTLPDEDGMAMAVYVRPSWWQHLLGHRPRWVVLWCTAYGIARLRPDTEAKGLPPP